MGLNSFIFFLWITYGVAGGSGASLLGWPALLKKVNFIIFAMSFFFLTFKCCGCFAMELLAPVTGAKGSTAAGIMLIFALL